MVHASRRHAQRIVRFAVRAERDLILEALRSDNGNRQVAAKRLGISPRTLRYKLATPARSRRRSAGGLRTVHMSSMEIDAVLAQIRAMQSQVTRRRRRRRTKWRRRGRRRRRRAVAGELVRERAEAGTRQVNQTQQSAADLATQFERGVPGVELPQVMLEMQKASVSFRALTEVRNKFVECVPGNHEHADLMNGMS